MRHCWLPLCLLFSLAILPRFGMAQAPASTPEQIRQTTLAAVRDPKSPDRRAALQQLVGWDGVLPPAERVPLLLSLLQSTDATQDDFRTDVFYWIEHLLIKNRDYPVILSEAQQLPLLLSLLQKPAVTKDEQTVQQYALQGIAAYGPQARATEPALIQIIEDPTQNDEARRLALDILSKLQTHSPAALAAVETVLNGPHTDSWSLAVPAPDALVRVASDPQTVMAILTRALRQGDKDNSYDDSNYFNYAAFQVLGLLAGRPADAPPLSTFTNYQGYGTFSHPWQVPAGSIAARIRTLQNLDKEPPDKIAEAFLALQTAGRKGVGAVPTLVSIIRHRPQGYLKAAALDTLGAVGPGATAESTRTLLAFRQPDGGLIGRLADAALYGIGPPDKAALGPIFAAFMEDEKRKEYYAEILARIGPSAAHVEPQIIRRLLASNTDLPGVRTPWDTLLRVLSHIGPPQGDEARKLVLQAVLDGLESNSGAVFANASRASGSLGPEAKPAVPLLLRAFGSTIPSGMLVGGTDGAVGYGYVRSTSVRLEAIRALAKIGPAASEAIPTLETIAAEPPEKESGSRLFPSLHENDEARKALQIIQKSEAKQ